MLSLAFVMQHVDGPLEPGDDMVGAEAKWLGFERITEMKDVSVPQDITLFQRTGVPAYGHSMDHRRSYFETHLK